MFENVLTLIAGLLGGVSVAIQSVIAGAMSQRVGGTASSFIIHVSGAILSGLLLVSRGGENIAQWRVLPWYMLGSGVFGVILYLTLNRTLPQLGASAAITLIIVGQLLTSMLIDHFGWFGVTIHSVDATRLLALGLLLVGGYLMVR